MKRKRRSNYPHTCKDCGKDFLGVKGANFCKECRTKRMKAGRERHGNYGPEPVEDVENRIHFIRREKEPLRMYEDCPNYNKDLVKCITCPAGSWRYKGCGTAKSAKDTSTNSN